MIGLVTAALVLGPASFVFADHARVDSLNSLGRGYIFSNIERSIEQYTQVAAEAKALGYRTGEARAWAKDSPPRADEIS